MTSDTPDKHAPFRNLGGGAHPSDATPLERAEVPVFNCIVYVSPQPGGVRARVANLPDLECTAAGERAALGQIVTAFKKRIVELMQSSTPIPWIDPPAAAEPGEQTRFIPVHL